MTFPTVELTNGGFTENIYIQIQNQNPVYLERFFIYFLSFTHRILSFCKHAFCTLRSERAQVHRNMEEKKTEGLESPEFRIIIRKCFFHHSNKHIFVDERVGGWGGWMVWMSV